MAVLIYCRLPMDKLLVALRKDFPRIQIVAGDTFYWSSHTHEIFYEPEGQPLSLLHELGHALLNHQTFNTDIELINKEVAAWEKARGLAHLYGLPFDSAIVESSLDTYRDWLYSRSTCPTCKRHGVQQAQRRYSCLNCGNTWKVSTSVLCRVYRQHKPALNAK